MVSGYFLLFKYKIIFVTIAISWSYFHAMRISLFHCILMASYSAEYPIYADGQVFLGNEIAELRANANFK